MPERILTGKERDDFIDKYDDEIDDVIDTHLPVHYGSLYIDNIRYFIYWTEMDGCEITEIK